MNLVFSFFLLGALTLSTGLLAAEEKAKGEETISLSGAWALYPMAVKWGEEYQKTHPGVKIDIAAGGAGKGIADCLAGMVDIGMVSREVTPAEAAKGAWWAAVTKDAVGPTVSAENPVLSDLLAKGVKKETLAGIWMTGKVKTWGEASGKDADAGDLPPAPAIHVYTRSDACGAAETWAKYLEGKQEDLQGIGSTAIRDSPRRCARTPSGSAITTSAMPTISGAGGRSPASASFPSISTGTGPSLPPRTSTAPRASWSKRSPRASTPLPRPATFTSSAGASPDGKRSPPSSAGC